MASASPAEGSHEPSKKYTMAQVAEHVTQQSCWLTIHGKVYDITKFIDEHPGGDIIFDEAGRDATEIFDSIHSSEARKTLAHYYIGDLDTEAAHAQSENITSNH